MKPFYITDEYDYYNTFYRHHKEVTLFGRVPYFSEGHIAENDTVLRMLAQAGGAVENTAKMRELILMRVID